MREDDELVLCLLIFSQRDLSSPRVDEFVKGMITSDTCRIKYEEAALEYKLSEEEQTRRHSFGCCDVCSGNIEKWLGEEDDRQKYSVGNQDLTSYLQDYFVRENEKKSSLGIMHFY